MKQKITLHKRSLDPSQPALTWEQVNENWQIIEDAFRDIINNTEADKYVVQYVNAYSDQILYSEHRISDPVVQAYNREGQKIELSIRVENNNITWTSTRRFSGKIIII